VNKLIDTGAVAAAYCVADESIDAFRRFHAALYAQQPEEERVPSRVEFG
jgi:protein-disulfide isomerase